MSTFFEPTGLAIAVIGVIFALCNCFFGYPLRKIWFALLGFMLGGALGYAVSTWLGQDAGIAALIGVAAGAVFALLSFKLYLCSVFLLCGGLFFMLWSVLLPATLSSMVHGMLVLGGIALSILIGIIAIKAVRPVVMITTAFSGGYTAVAGLFTLIYAEQGTLSTVLGIALGAAGLIFQFAADKRRNAAIEAVKTARPYIAPEYNTGAPYQDAAPSASPSSASNPESEPISPDTP